MNIRACTSIIFARKIIFVFLIMNLKKKKRIKIKKRNYLRYDQTDTSRSQYNSGNE